MIPLSHSVPWAPISHQVAASGDEREAGMRVVAMEPPAHRDQTVTTANNTFRY